MRYTLNKDEGVTTLHYVVDSTFRLSTEHQDGSFDITSLCLRDQIEVKWKRIDDAFIDVFNPTEEELLTWQMVYPELINWLPEIQKSIRLIQKNNEYHKEIF